MEHVCRKEWSEIEVVRVVLPDIRIVIGRLSVSLPDKKIISCFSVRDVINSATSQITITINITMSEESLLSQLCNIW